MLDLSATDIGTIQSILHDQVPECEVWAFGSRVTGRSRKFSDLDLAIRGPAHVDWRRLEALRDALSESDLPIQVDVVDWNAVSEGFRQIILGQREWIAGPQSDAP